MGKAAHHGHVFLFCLTLLVHPERQRLHAIVSGLRLSVPVALCFRHCSRFPPSEHVLTRMRRR
ncbi:hypothetical protein AERO9AM_10258 [Aeromicrobium sp. 9AM]|nr:hypothetical protein AERO9AM_10258 [Aeromicrobium sp. 9AM]